MNRMIAPALALALLAPVLAGCAGFAERAAVTASKTLSLAEDTYVAVCKAKPAIEICVDPMKAKIQAADKKAYDAVTAALAKAELVDEAWAAVTAFAVLAK